MRNTAVWLQPKLRGLRFSAWCSASVGAGWRAIWRPLRASSPKAPRRIGRTFAWRRMHPAQLGGTVLAIVACPLGGDLEVFAKLLVARLRPHREYVLSQLIPIQVEGEGVE